jgi:hypothetical protein
MKVVQVSDVHQFLGFLDRHDMDIGRWGFRGVPSETYDLIPSVGRSDVREDYDQELEKLIFHKFRQMAVPFLSTKPENLVTWLALARHHGLPTRLLDWTLSPLIAAFFATTPTSGAPNSNFAIYAYESDYFDPKPDITDPFSLDAEFVEIHADHYSERMAAQRGFFTLHRNPNQPFRVNSLFKFIFPSNVKTRTVDVLDFYGVNRSSLFPGLDGIAQYWGWFYGISTPG